MLRHSQRILGSSSTNFWRWGASGSDVAKTPILVEEMSGDSSVRGMAHGLEHSALIDQHGNVPTYGSNKYDQLGRASPEDIGPVDMDEESIAEATSVSCGAWHTLSVHKDGSVRSFGWGGSFLGGAGALGHGTKSARRKSRKIEFFETINEKITQVASGAQHSLFLTSTNLLFATGQGGYGILGNGDSNDQLFPVEITALSACLSEGENIKKISAGNSFSVLLTDRGNLYVWGRNDHGQLGLGEESQGDMHSAERYPRKIPFFDTQMTVIRDVVCGENHVVAVADNGAIYYWGDRTWLEPHLVALPEANGGLQKITKIAAGSKCSFALTDDGILYTWGARNSGCLVLPDLKKSPIVPTPIHPAFFGHQKLVDVSVGRQRCSAVTLKNELIVTTESEAAALEKDLKAKQTIQQIGIQRDQM